MPESGRGVPTTAAVEEIDSGGPGRWGALLAPAARVDEGAVDEVGIASGWVTAGACEVSRGSGMARSAWRKSRQREDVSLRKSKKLESKRRETNPWNPRRRQLPERSSQRPQRRACRG